jgi:hypothetical protein
MIVTLVSISKLVKLLFEIYLIRMISIYSRQLQLSEPQLTTTQKEIETSTEINTSSYKCITDKGNFILN